MQVVVVALTSPPLPLPTALQVVVIFFGNVLAGSLLNQVQQLGKDPTSLVSILGKALPMAATFFISYLLTSVSTGYNITFFFYRNSK